MVKLNLFQLAKCKKSIVKFYEFLKYCEVLLIGPDLQLWGSWGNRNLEASISINKLGYDFFIFVILEKEMF
jgi:hypothetical protein